jgi:hypothetical protein
MAPAGAAASPPSLFLGTERHCRSSPFLAPPFPPASNGQRQLQLIFPRLWRRVAFGGEVQTQRAPLLRRQLGPRPLRPPLISCFWTRYSRCNSWTFRRKLHEVI